MVASVTDDCEMICAALLHDVIEDCGVTKQDLLDAGFGIAKLVTDLTNIRSGKPRRERKADNVYQNAILGYKLLKCVTSGTMLKPCI